MMKGGLGNMMKQAQKMQEQMQQVQEQVASMQVTGESGAGLVKVTLTGKHECKAVAIDPSAIDDDMEMLEDLVAAAINDASTKLAESSAEQMASVTNGMNLPPGFKMPF